MQLKRGTLFAGERNFALLLLLAKNKLDKIKQISPMME